MFLKGKNHEVIHSLVEKMEEASQTLKFEKAALYRDQIGYLRKVQEQQWVSGAQEEMDVFGFASRKRLGQYSSVVYS